MSMADSPRPGAADGTDVAGANGGAGEPSGAGGASRSGPAGGADEPSGAGGGTEVTESWWDQRGRGAHVLGRVFTGKVANNRAEANREGMRTTLARLKRELEAG